MTFQIYGVLIIINRYFRGDKDSVYIEECASNAGSLEDMNVLWNGYYFDAETGNYYLRNRYYSPLERRFVTEDPRGINPDENWENYFNIHTQYDDGYGLEVYATGDPVNNKDEWGLTKRKICCKINTTTQIYIPPGMGVLPGGNYPTTKCSQNTVEIGAGKASPLSACQCYYRHFPNIEVYGAEGKECCSCTVKVVTQASFMHTKLVVDCDKGGKSWVGDITGIAKSTKLWDLIVGVSWSYPTPQFNSSSGGFLNWGSGCKINCKQAEQFRTKLAGTPYLYSLPISNCFTWAIGRAQDVCAGCP